MTTVRMYKTFRGMVLPQSTIRAPDGRAMYVLMDSSTDIGTNVTRSEYITGYPPYGTPGIVHDRIFMYPVPFSGNTIVDGMVEGNVAVTMMCTGTSSDYVQMTGISVELAAHSSTGIRSLSGEKTIWGESMSRTVTGTESTATIGPYFAFPIFKQRINTDEYFAMRVRVYGMRSTSGSTGMIFRLLVDKDDDDMLLSIPLVEA